MLTENIKFFFCRPIEPE